MSPKEMTPASAAVLITAIVTVGVIITSKNRLLVKAFLNSSAERR